MKLKSDEFMILAVLCDGELHGKGIMQGVYRMTNGGLMLWSAGLYRVLGLMTRRGLIEQVKKPIGRDGGQGQRAFYRITATGRQLVQEEAELRAKGA